MTQKERVNGLLLYFQQALPDARTELHYHSPFELLVAVVLSAQCTDKRVNQSTPALFKAYPSPEAMTNASPELIYPYVKSISYPNNKAKHLYALACILVQKHRGQVPSSSKDLMALAGVVEKQRMLC